MIRVFRHFLPGGSLFLLLIDAVVLTTVVYCLVVVRAGFPIFSEVGTRAEIALTMSALAILSMASLGLYSPLILLNYRITLVRTLLAFLVASPIVFLAARASHEQFGFPQEATAIWFIKITSIGFLSILATRTAFLLMWNVGLFKRRLLVLGTGKNAALIAQLAKKHKTCSFELCGFVRTENGDDEPHLQLDQASFNDPESFFEYAREKRVREIIIATDDRRGLPVHQLLRCKLAGIKVTDFLSFWERETGRVGLDALRPSWLILSDGFRTGWLVDFSKRCFDIVVSVSVLIFTMPVLLITAILIKLDGPGPILYRQERIGLYGRPFTIFKFRSMATAAEAVGEPQWARLKDDRITRTGAYIRKVRIDELPQLINVLRGEMSFVGPRPERPFFVEQLAAEIPFYRERHSVKPGITGWAQIQFPYGASISDARDKLSYDLYYVKNRGMFLDFVILVETVRVVLWAEGAH